MEMVLCRIPHGRGVRRLVGDMADSASPTHIVQTGALVRPSSSAESVSMSIAHRALRNAKTTTPGTC